MLTRFKVNGFKNLVDVDVRFGPFTCIAVNTHSPAVVAQIPDDSLLVAELSESLKNGARFKSVRFSCLSDTWRQKAPEQPPAVTKGKLMSYLNPIEPEESAPYYGTAQKKTKGVKRRVIDRSDLQQMSLLYAAEPK